MNLFNIILSCVTVWKLRALRSIDHWILVVYHNVMLLLMRVYVSMVCSTKVLCPQYIIT